MAYLISQGLGAAGRLVFQGYGLPLFTSSLVLANETVQGDSSLPNGTSEAATAGSPIDSIAAVTNDAAIAGYSVSSGGDVTIQSGGEG